METKICSKCKKEKSINDFNKHKDRKYGVQSYCKKCRKEHRILTKEKIATRMAKYHSCNKEKRNIKERFRRKNEPKFKLEKNMGRDIYDALKFIGRSKDGRKWESLVGYSASQLKEHLEKQFKPEMNWENHGTYWHIDHKKPKSWFNYDNAEHPEFKQCWALENLQPLEAKENMKKSNKYEG